MGVLFHTRKLEYIHGLHVLGTLAKVANDLENPKRTLERTGARGSCHVLALFESSYPWLIKLYTPYLASAEREKSFGRMTQSRNDDVPVIRWGCLPLFTFFSPHAH